MHVLWLVRDNLETHPGGDTTQILQTAAALHKRGVRVEFADRLPHRIERYDVVHLFHLDRLWEHLAVCKRLRRTRTPAVLSTIYWPADEFDRAARIGFQGTLARLLGSENYQSLRQIQRLALARLRGGAGGWDRRLLRFRDAARRLLDTVRVVLPNSAAERDEIRRCFGCCPPAVVVPNAVNIEQFGPPGEDPPERAGVLCVGRIEPRKNQLALIEALRDTGIPLTLIGQVGRFSRRYGRRCWRAAGPNIRFLDHAPPAALREHYRRAAVHACVSWYETPGLASLEAAVCGCGVVVTPGGCTREYFGDHAHYARPDDPGSIRTAVHAALADPPGSGLARLVAERYNWDAAAERTIEGYELAIRQPDAATRPNQ